MKRLVVIALLLSFSVLAVCAEETRTNEPALTELQSQSQSQTRLPGLYQRMFSFAFPSNGRYFNVSLCSMAHGGGKLL